MFIFANQSIADMGSSASKNLLKIKSLNITKNYNKHDRKIFFIGTVITNKLLIGLISNTKNKPR